MGKSGSAPTKFPLFEPMDELMGGWSLSKTEKNRMDVGFKMSRSNHFWYVVNWTAVHLPVVLVANLQVAS